MLPTGLLRGFVLPAAECLTRTRFWSYYKESLRFDRWDDGRREALRDRRLAQVWEAARSTALHRQRLAEAGLPSGPLGPDDARELLGRLPPVGKSAFRRWFPAGVTTAGRAEDWRYQSTAGTTADRMTVIADFRKRDHGRSSELRVLRLALGVEVGLDVVEIPPNACNVVCGVVESGPPSLLGYFWQAVRQRTLFSREAQIELRGRVERQVVSRVRTLPPLEPMPAPALSEVVDRYLEQIAAVRPAHLRAFPLYLLWLADRCRDRGAAPAGLKAVGPYGGLASPAMMERIAGGLGCRFLQKYGTSELGVVSGACGRSPGMHVFEDLFLVEAFRGGRPVGPGQVGRLAVTDLINTAMPLIRYEVGDVGRLHLTPCPCGRRTARLEVLGRAQETLDAPAGPVTASDVADTVFGDPAISNFRMEEVAPGSFEVAFVGRASAAPKIDAWRDRFEAVYGRLNRVRTRLVPFVRPESSGKYRFVFPRTDGPSL
jgi:phenylacetate-CoA ligase